MKEGSWWEGREGEGRGRERGRGRGGPEGDGRGGNEGEEGIGERVGEGKERKEGKEESVAAHYSLGNSVGPHGSLACGLSVFVCVDFLM